MRLSHTHKAFVRRSLVSPLVGAVTPLARVLHAATGPRPWNLDRPVFIVGAPRSGTTVFADVMGRHDELAHWSEAGQVLQRRYYDPAADHRMAPGDATPADRARIRVLFGAYRRLAGKPRFLNKNPRNSLRIDLLRDLYPDAMFVHLVRDGRAVVESNWRQSNAEPFRRELPFGGFCKPPEWRRHLAEGGELVPFAHQWAGIVAHVRDALAALPSAAAHEVRYEDFCRDPDRVLAEVDRFCGLAARDPGRRASGSAPGEGPAATGEIRARTGTWRVLEDHPEWPRVLEVLAPVLAACGYTAPDASRG